MAIRDLFKTKRPKTGEQTGEQDPRKKGGLSGVTTEMQIPGFREPEKKQDYKLYREISSHPTVALVMEIVKSPIISNEWAWHVKDGTPDEWLQTVKEMLDGMRHQAINDGLRGLEFGWAGFEKVWKEEDGSLVLQRLKPLIPEHTEILVDRGGNFRGLKNGVAGRDTIELFDSKAWLYTHNAEFGNLYGRSRHENIRNDYDRSLQIADRLAQYLKKIAGLVVQLHYPDGTSKDVAGADRPNDFIAQQILDAVSQGKSVRLPNLFASMADQEPLKAAELAGKSQWVLSALDIGGSDHSTGLLAALEYIDKRLVRGWLRPERSAIEGQHGTMAEASAHTDTGMTDSELVDQDFASQFNRGVVDDVLAMNFGEQARGAVFAVPSPITDGTAANKMSLLKQMLSDKATSASVAGKIDVDEILKDLDIPMVQGSEGTIKIETPHRTIAKPGATDEQIQQELSRLMEVD